jgi:hypothetical protein
MGNAFPAWAICGSRIGQKDVDRVMLDHRGMGAELKPSYYRQAVKNVTAAANGVRFDGDTEDLFAASSMD